MVLIQISLGYPAVKGRLHTRYAPVRRSLVPKNYTPRLACVKPAASVHPEPGSNSSSYIVRLIAQASYYATPILSVFSNLSILLLLFFCSKISLKAAVNSICLGTCSSCFLTSISTFNVALKAGAKLQLLFNLTSFFKSFLENKFSPLFYRNSDTSVSLLAQSV